jgi:hypothetical protein
VGLRSFRHWPPNNASTDAAFHPRRGQGRPRPQPAVTDAGHLLGHLARGLRPAPPRPPHALAVAMHNSAGQPTPPAPAIAGRGHPPDPLATSPATRPTGQLTGTRPPPGATGLSANATANSPHRGQTSAATASGGTASNPIARAVDNLAGRPPGRRQWPRTALISRRGLGTSPSIWRTSLAFVTYDTLRDGSHRCTRCWRRR